MKKVKLPRRTAGARRVTFQVTAAPKSEVCLAGTFNQWDAKRHPMKDTKGTGTYTITLMLPRGEYQYKFVVNGTWVVDPECRNWVRNNYGTLNSLLKVE